MVHEEDINPDKLSNEVLLRYHIMTHIWWEKIIRGEVIEGWSVDDVFKKHREIAEEMTARELGLNEEGLHATPLQEQRREELNSINPFKFVRQPEPLKGRFERQIYSPETAEEIILSLKEWEEQLQYGIFVDKKQKGFGIQLHKVGNKIQVWNYRGEEITQKVTSLLNEIKKINHDFIADGIVEEKKYNEIEGTEKDLKIIISDLLWINGRDISQENYKERLEQLKENINQTINIKISFPKLVKSIGNLKKEVMIVSKLPGSKGAILKKSTFIYPKNEHTSGILKFENRLSINAELVKMEEVEGTNLIEYLTTINSGTKKISCGSILHEKIDAEIGNNLKVIFVELNKNIDPKTKKIWYEFFAPKIVGLAKESDSMKTAESLVEKSGGRTLEKAFCGKGELINNDNYNKEFKNNALLWETEEFDFALSKGWIDEKTIPKELAQGGMKVIKNKEEFLIKKEVMGNAMVILRNEKNEITHKKLVNLVEVT